MDPSCFFFCDFFFGVWLNFESLRPNKGGPCSVEDAFMMGLFWGIYTGKLRPPPLAFVETFPDWKGGVGTIAIS